MISVTQALSVVGKYGMVNASVLERAAELGTLVHQHCLAHLRGLYMPTPPDILVWVVPFKTWCDAMVDDVLGVEYSLEDKPLQLVGHLDMAARLKKHKGKDGSVVDLKRICATPDKMVGLQLAAYAHLCPKSWNIKHRYALHLKPDGKLHLIPFTNPNDWPMFLSCYSLYNYLSK
jgi:hypothetical protein